MEDTVESVCESQTYHWPNRMKKYSIICICCLYFSAFANLFSDSLNSIALYLVLPAAFFLCLVSGGLKVNKYMRILTALLVWIAFSYLWAKDTDLAARQLHQILGTFLLAVIFTVQTRNARNISWLYVTYVILFASAWLYARNHIFQFLGEARFRLNDEKLNANTMAYMLFYVTFSIFILAEVVGRRYVKVFRILFLGMIPLSFVTAILTASRQVLLIQIPLICILLYFRYFKGRRFVNKSAAVIVLAVAIAIASPYLVSVYENSYLAERSSESIGDDSRIKLAKEAYEIGIEHFPLGVGANNYLHYSYNKHFSHNNYLELFANEGIIGLWLYLWLMFAFILAQWRRYKRLKDNVYLYFLVFGIFYVLDGLFFAFYAHLWLMGFFMLVAGHSETYYRCQISLRGSAGMSENLKQRHNGVACLSKTR